ncbi:MAG: alpha/beta hydrolase [Pseudomonadota bacterium]
MKKFLHITKMTVSYLVQLLIIALIVGRIYEVMAEARDDKRLPPPGQLYDVDGHVMHMHCQGQGSPTIVVEQGNGAQSLGWSEVNEGLSHVSRTCAYDRAGMGYSEPVRGPASASDIAQNLQKLLVAAEINDDLVLVGWSAGGIYQREFYRQFPERVKGMVLVDSAHEQQTERLPPAGDDASLDADKFYQVLAPFGAVRLSGLVEQQFSNSTFSAPIRDRLININLKSHMHRTLLNESEGFDAELAQLRTPPALNNLPLIVIAEGKPDTAFMQENLPIWNELQQELKGLSSNSRLVVAENSPHEIHRYQPGLIVESVSEVVTAVRNGGRIRTR